MGKHVHRPICLFRPGDHIQWKDSDGDWLIRHRIYTVKAVDGPWFNIEGCPVRWGYEPTQFDLVEQ